MQMEVVVNSFKVLSWHMAEGIKENHKEPESGMLNIWLSHLVMPLIL